MALHAEAEESLQTASEALGVCSLSALPGMVAVVTLPGSQILCFINACSQRCTMV